MFQSVTLFQAQVTLGVLALEDWPLVAQLPLGYLHWGM